jgi:hypothetical protein
VACDLTHAFPCIICSVVDGSTAESVLIDSNNVLNPILRRVKSCRKTGVQFHVCA